VVVHSTDALINALSSGEVVAALALADEPDDWLVHGAGPLGCLGAWQNGDDAGAAEMLGVQKCRALAH
jgi:hypothetical protein